MEGADESSELRRPPPLSRYLNNFNKECMSHVVCVALVSVDGRQVIGQELDYHQRLKLFVLNSTMVKSNANVSIERRSSQK